MAKAVEHDVDIVFCNAQEYEENSKKAYRLYKIPDGFNEGEPITLDTWAKREKALPVYLPPWAKIVSLKLVRQHNLIFSGDENLHDDILFHYHATLITEKIIYLDEVLYTHRIFSGSITGMYQEKGVQTIIDVLHTWNDIEKICEKENIAPQKVLAVFQKEFAIYAYRAPNSLPYIKKAQDIFNHYGLTESDVPQQHIKHYRKIMHYWWGRKVFYRIKRLIKLRIRTLRAKNLS